MSNAIKMPISNMDYRLLSEPEIIKPADVLSDKLHFQALLPVMLLRVFAQQCFHDEASSSYDTIMN